MTRTLIILSLVAPAVACTVAPTGPRRTTVAEPRPTPAAEPMPAPEPIAELEPEDQLANPFEEDLAEDLALDDPSCPMTVPDTTVAFVETDTGAALSFETSDVAELKGKIDALVVAHNDTHHPPDLVEAEEEVAAAGEEPERDDPILASGGVRAAPAGTEAILPVTTPSEAFVEISGTGIRLVYVTQPEHLDALREEISGHAVVLAGGRCIASP